MGSIHMNRRARIGPTVALSNTTVQQYEARGQGAAHELYVAHVQRP